MELFYAPLGSLGIVPKSNPRNANGHIKHDIHYIDLNRKESDSQFYQKNALSKSEKKKRVKIDQSKEIIYIYIYMYISNYLTFPAFP